MYSNHSKAMFDRVVTQVGVLPLEELLPALLGEIAALLGVERVGYYRMEENGSVIRLEIQFLLSTGECEAPEIRLHAADYPGYFSALHEPSNLVVSHDVMGDSRLLEFHDPYFKPLGITSMLDVPVHRSGKLFGVICLEHTGAPRQWTAEEVELARSLGHLVALAIETRDRTRIEEELRLALEREKELVELKSNFISLVSHEFRTPLGVIYSAADILESYFDRLDPGQRADHLHDIRHSARQMSNLMEEVLVVGKVESPGMVCRTEPVDLVGLCRRILDEQISAASGKCPVSLEIDELLGKASADGVLLRHILGNLLSNAVKYSPAGSPVDFTVRREGATAEFTVTDRGIGIHPDDHPQLFGAFFRGRNVGSRTGTGLGLVIVERCVALHGGTVSFESRPGAGTRFVVRLELFPPSGRHRPRRAAGTAPPVWS